jgi:hypothetical protein
MASSDNLPMDRNIYHWSNEINGLANANTRRIKCD